MEILIKNRSDLKPSEKEQIASLMKTYIAGINQDYIDLRIEDGAAFDIVLLKNEDALLAFSYYHLTHVVTPFAKKKIPVLQFGTSMKDKGYKGNTIWTLGNWYGRNKIDRLFLAKKIVGVTHTYNPKICENFNRLFKNNYPFKNTPLKEHVQFLENYLGELRDMKVTLDRNLCFTDPNVANTDITEDWERMYKAKSSDINDYFFKIGVVKKVGNRIIRTGVHVVLIGYRNPLAFLS